GSALGRFDVFPWFAGQQRERRARRRHYGSVSRTRQLLAIRAVADRDLFWIYDGLISDGTAVTFAVDFHPRRSPHSPNGSAKIDNLPDHQIDANTSVQYAGCCASLAEDC